MCKSGMRPCPKGWCIKESLFCDGHSDCEDGFDEIGCGFKVKIVNATCDDDEFQCPSEPTRCLSQSEVCNDRPECPKGEDEKNCATCPKEMFECNNGQCIISTWVCDKTNDCGDNSDEENCNKPEERSEQRVCDPKEFKCSDGTCLKYGQVCDGRKDCSDDEGGSCSSACKDTPCQQHCTATPKGAICSCDAGFQLGSAGDKKCVDIDECATLNPCGQMCSNNVGSFQCSCHEGFVLGTDKRECTALGGQAQIFYSFFDHIRKMTENPREIDVVVDTDGFWVVDFDINVEQQKLWFSAVGEGEMVELNLKTKELTPIDSFPFAGRFAHDWIAGNHYIAHYPEDMQIEVHVCSTDTLKCILIAKHGKHDMIPSIQIDPISKQLFYVLMQNSLFLKPSSTIIKTRLDGSDPKRIWNDTLISTMAIDTDQQLVYFTETESQSLAVMDYSGRSQKVLTKQTRMLKRPIAMSLFENHAFILNQANSYMTRCRLYGDMECRQIDIMANSASRVVIAQESRQKSVKNPCADHRCGGVCIPADIGVKCLCMNGTSVVQGASCDVEVCLKGGCRKFSSINLSKLFSSQVKRRNQTVHHGCGHSLSFC